MSLPGLGLSDLDEPVASAVTPTDYNIGRECEWRFEVGIGSCTQVKVRVNASCLSKVSLR